MFYEKKNPPVASKKGEAFARWSYGFILGFFIGGLLLFLALAMTGVELGRIIGGSLNHNGAQSYALYPNNIYFPAYYTTANVLNIQRQQSQYLWPWSSPALFFAIIVII